MVERSQSPLYKAMVHSFLFVFSDVYNDMIPHELEEALHVLQWVNAGDFEVVSSKDVSLGKVLSLLSKIILLQIVDYCHVIYELSALADVFVPVPNEVSNNLYGGNNY